MQIPLQITFRGMDPSDAVEARIREKAEKLERFHNHIISCRVVVETPHGHHHKGKRYQVRIDLKVPDGELAVNHEHHHQDRAHEDIYVAVRDAFDAAQRQVEDYLRRDRGVVKNHEEADYGRVLAVLPEAGYGKIETRDGRVVYFHRNSVLGDAFDGLDVGSEVYFAEEMGEQGPQASTVRPAGKHHPVG